MFPSSSRVKLNRVALKDVIGLKLVPRRRRVPRSQSNVTADSEEKQEENQLQTVKDTNVTPVPSCSEHGQTPLTDQICPENVTDTAGGITEGEPEENRVTLGTQKAKREINPQLCKGSDSVRFKLEGPYTVRKNQQRKSRTRTRCRLDRLRNPCNFRLRFTCGLCADTDSALREHTEVHRRETPRGKMSCQIELSSKTPLPITSKATKTRTLSGLKSSMWKSFGRRCQSRRGHVKRKHRVTHVKSPKSGDRGEGHSKAKARSTGGDPAKTGQVQTGSRSIPTGLSNFDRNPDPGSTGLADSERSSRRAVRTSHCGLCGDCKYISPQRKTLGKKGQESSSPGPEQPTVEVKIKKENTATETSKKIVIWIGQYPKVPLCNIAQKCDLSHNCGYVLPDALKTKVVHCFKQDMRAGFQFVPGCLGHNKHKSDEGALAKEFCHRAQSEKSFSHSQRLTKHQKHLNELAGAQALSSHPSCRFLKSWTSDGSATCSTSFLLGKRTKKGECRSGMWDSDVEEDPGPGSRLIGAEICRDKRIKLRDSVDDGILPSTSDLESMSCENPAKTDTRDKEKTCLGHTVGGSSMFGSAVKENCVYKNPCGERGSPAKSDPALSSKQFCQRKEVNTDELESFTCQRARVYLRKNISSCARTYMSWPFSNSGWTLTAHAGTTARPEEPVDPSTTDKTDSPIKQNQPGSSSNQTAVMLPNAPTSGKAHQFCHQNEEKQQEDSESILADRNGKGHNMSSYSSESEKSATHLMEAEESLASLPSDMAALSNPRQHGREPGTDTVSASPLPGPNSDSSLSTPSPSALGLSDWETATTLSSMSSPFTHGGLSSLSATPSSLPTPSFLLQKVKRVELAEASPTKCMVSAVGKTLFCCEETRTSPPHDSDSFHSCESSLLLPQDEQESDDDLLTAMSKGRSMHNILTDKWADIDLDELMLPPMLSPVNTPQGPSRTSFQHPGCSDEEEEEEEEEINKDTSKHKMIPECHMPQIVNGNKENSKDYLEDGVEEFEGASTNLPTTQTSTSNDEDNVDDGNEEEDQNDSDYEDDVEQVNKQSEQVPSDSKIKATLTSGDLTEPCSSPSSDEDDGGAFRVEGQTRSAREVESSPSEISDSERDETKVEAEDDTQQGILDEVTAYEQDILLVDVIQFDPELFENLPQESSLKLGPCRVTEAPKIRPIGRVKTQSSGTDAASPGFIRSFPVHTDFHCDSPITEESTKRPWRPRCGSSPFKRQSSASPAAEKQTKHMGLPDANNNHVNECLERSQPVQTVTSLHYHIPPLMTQKIGPWITNPANLAEFRRQKSNAYCRQYFSESLSCGFKMCRFQHVPVEGDEKFCVDTVTRFTKNPACLQKAGAVFTGYYQNNPPGVYFSMPVLLSLLWSLLKAGMVSDVFSVLSISVAHKIVPGHEFLLALFNLVREKGLVSFVPELMQLTFKMASTGLELSLDCLDCVKNTPEFQQTVHPNSLVLVSGNHKLSSSAPFPEYLNLAHAIVEVELCTKQEDWRRMGEVFRSICQSSQHPNQVERISGRIAIALLSESKDKLSPPFAAFADTMCQTENEDSLFRSFLGRIGVSLMLRYHKTHQWAKGRRVVEVLSIAKIEYSTLKGLFGNEDGASRCYLVTVATELFLLSGSVEGALNTLRENKWFLSSRSWPCEPADLESRTRVLIRLAEKTSHRDTLDVLCNLPGLKEPNDMVDVSKYSHLFNSHLQVCVDRQTLPVASDTVDFMLCKNLAVDHAMLQILIHKLGKQNLWLRAREVFRHSLSMGYYPEVSAPPGFMSLIVPCRLGEVELALTFEMFITVNAAAILHLSETTTSCLSITLKRTQSCESEYLSAGSRLLSAACIPLPKLIIHYNTAVNASQEQVFTLDISSARCWLRHNHLWANEVWTLNRTVISPRPP